MTESSVTNKVAVCGDAVVQEVNEYVEIAKAWLFEKGIDFAINAAVALVILLVGWIAIKVISALVNRAMTKGGMKKTLFTDLVTSVVRKGCWAVLIVMVLSRLGINVGPIIAGLGVTGFILGFAFQESLGNLASGLMIAINEPFKVGDYVIVAGLDGEVLKVDMMATVLATADNKKVVIPNKSAWGSPITNFSALGRRRVDLKVGIAYSSDIGKAIQIALDTLNKLPGVLQEPKATVSIASLDDSAVTLNVRPWANCSDYWDVYSGGYKAVKEAFDANGIAIPFPQMDVHLNQQ
jgi:small conductance mechanosensitive channel